MDSECKHWNCARPTGKALGYCNAHYDRQRKGKPMDPPILKYAPNDEQRFWLKVNKTDSCWLWTGAKHKGYGVARVGGSARLAHRVAWTWTRGVIPAGAQLDHMCHNRACVNPEHIRFSDWETNGQNRAGANKNSRTGIRGVYWNEDRRGWFAAITLANEITRRGPFSEISAAEQAAIELRRQHMPFSVLDRKEVS